MALSAQMPMNEWAQARSDEGPAVPAEEDDHGLFSATP
jgi:hypothetical protein